MKRFVLCLFAAVLLSALLVPMVALTEQPSLSARHAVIYEPLTGTFLYDRNGDKEAPMASTTKIMTALVALKKGNLDTSVTIPKEACGIEGSSIYLVEGEVLTLEQLLYALLLQSANDAATAIAIAVGGTQEDFVSMMNQEAEALGLAHTHFTNPHGLDNQEHYTTARDLAVITAAAMEIPLFCEMVSTVKYSIPHSTPGGSRLLVNHNKLLRMYEGATGVKTGFTKHSGRCLVGAAIRDGITLITVTLDAPNDWQDHIRMFEHGFSRMENRLIYDIGQYTCEIPLWGEEGTVLCSNSEPLYAILPKGATAPDISLDLPHYLVPPVKNGQAIGTITLVHQGKEVGGGILTVTLAR